MKHDHGGVRPGAGRPPGTSKFGEATKTLRVPESAVPGITSYLNEYRLRKLAAAIPSQAVAIDPPELLLEHMTVRVPAGAAMPASDEVEYRGDLNQMLIRNPSKTRIMIASGTSMNLAGIDDGDSMIVDCSLEARHRDIVVAIILGDGHTVKRLELGKRVTRLVPESSDPIHQVREIRPDDEWMVWGVVTGCIKRFR